MRAERNCVCRGALEVSMHGCHFYVSVPQMSTAGDIIRGRSKMAENWPDSQVCAGTDV